MVNSFKPRSELLKKYVRDFSTFEKDCDLRINFATFPHIGPALAFFRNAVLNISRTHLQVNPIDGDRFNTIVLGKYTRPVFITYNGYVDEISVNFTPLGINYFFDEPYNLVAPDNFQKLKDEKWIDFGKNLLKIENIELRLRKFEDFLIERFRDPGLDNIQIAVEMLADKNEEYKVEEAAEAAGISERTLRRYFLKYIGCTPILFRRIVRFRNAINADNQKSKYPNITKLGYENQFYDSSHFAREYKIFSGRNPRSFFKDVSFFGNSDYPCIFL